MSLFDVRYLRHFTRNEKPVLSAEVRAHSRHRVREQPVLFQVGADGYSGSGGGSVEVWAGLLNRQVTLMLSWRWRKGSRKP